jgi:hypothetical protein
LDPQSTAQKGPARTARQPCCSLLDDRSQGVRRIWLAEEAQQSCCFCVRGGELSGGGDRRNAETLLDLPRRGQAIASSCQVDVHQYEIRAFAGDELIRSSPVLARPTTVWPNAAISPERYPARNPSSSAIAMARGFFRCCWHAFQRARLGKIAHLMQGSGNEPWARRKSVYIPGRKGFTVWVRPSAPRPWSADVIEIHANI